MRRKKKYVIGYVVLILIISSIYFIAKTDAESQSHAIFATKDLPPGSIVRDGDFVVSEGVVLMHEKDQLFNGTLEDLIGQQVNFGVRKDRPLLAADIANTDGGLHEVKLVGDITIPEDAKVVTISIVFDQRNFPGEQPKVIAENVPVKQVYNNQNVPIDMTDAKMNKVPKAISVLVNDKQLLELREHQNKGVFQFTKIP